MLRSSASHLHLDERRCRRGENGRKEGGRERMCQGSLGGAVSLLSSPAPSEGEEEKNMDEGRCCGGGGGGGGRQS